MQLTLFAKYASIMNNYVILNKYLQEFLFLGIYNQVRGINLRHETTKFST